MKKLLFTSLTLATVGILYWLFIPGHSAVVKSQLQAKNVTNSTDPISETQKYQQTPSGTGGQTTAQPNNAPMTNSVNKPHTLSEWMDQEYGHAIEFYGKVAEEDETPIANATIAFDWVNADGGGLHASTTSDGTGLFSITNIKGKNLGVTVSKNGYYPRGSSFEYADPGRGLFTPDARNPVVFHLRKKGAGVDLITSQNGMSAGLKIHIPRDGTPMEVDFLQRKAGDSGQMQIAEIKPDFKNWKQATNWSFQMTIPGGGFVEENDEFPFTAPENGYQPMVSFNFQKDQPDWVTDINTNYYIEFGNPPCFGWLHVETGISYGGAILTYAINPSGSQNLEPK